MVPALDLQTGLVATRRVRLHCSLFGALVIYDLWSGRRIHRVTALGVALDVAVLGASVALGLSPFGRALVERLR